MFTGWYHVHSYMLVNGRRVLLAAQTHVLPSSDTEGESGSGTMEQINGKQLTIRRPVDGTQHLLKCMSENGVPGLVN